MKHVIFCTYPSIYSSIVLQQLLEAQNIHIDAIIASTVTKKNTHFPSLSILKNSGIRYASYLWIVTTLFNLLPRKQQLSVGELAKDRGIPYFKTPDINKQPTASFLREYPSAQLLTAHFNQIIDVSLPSFNDRTCINMHPSLLPRNKGVDPAFYALLRKEKTQGVTLHEISNNIDAGDIYIQQETHTLTDSSLFTTNMQLFKIGAKSFIEALDTDEVRTPQNNSGNYDSWPQRKDAHQVKSFIRLRDFFRAIY